MTSALLSLFTLSVLAAGADDAAAIELRYTGSLSKASRAADESAVKRFNLYCVVLPEPSGGRKVAFSISERGGGSWPWPERFGAIDFDAGLKAVSPGAVRLLYEYEGNPLVIPLPSPFPVAAAELKAGGKWTSGKESWEVLRKTEVLEHSCWQVQVSTSFGLKRTLWIDTDSSLLVRLEERVFVGQGDEHALAMQLETFKRLDAAQAARDTRALPGLLKLQADLARPENEARSELSAAQIKLVGDALPGLQKDAEDTPFSPLVSAIAKDLKSQVQRTDEVARLAEKFVGKPAPNFSLRLTDNSEVSSPSLKDKITVLHFWEYQAEPLVEPYGQVGYLEFLYSKRRKLGVQVFGIAVDGRFAEPQAAPAAQKSIQKLKGFMNLTYAIATDDGKLLARFGDPPKYGAKLPLWVVIGPDGNVAHFHAGFYKINPDEGLRELDDVLVKLVREHKGASEKK